VVIPVAGLVGLIVVIAGLAGGTKTAKVPVVTPVTAPASSQPAPTQPAAVVPSPDGTFQGSCNYDLGSDPAGGTATATGDIDATNTGNIGIVVRLTITWPQEGFSPLKMTRTIRLPKGGEQDVQFHRPLSYDQISRLQDYQTGHGFKDGCTYKGEMTSTFGQAS
jgi:hypothetical protein